MQQTKGNTEPPPMPLSEHVRASLRRYDTHTTMTCLECGYAGLMGVKRSSKPWYLSWWMFFVYAVVFAPLSWFFIICFVLAEIFMKTHKTECPNCGIELVSKRHVL